MAVEYKEKCRLCRKNYVKSSWRHGFVVCYECQKPELEKAVKDPVLKKLCDIPEEFYKENAFLRDIKINCVKFGRLTDKQIEAFKKTVEKMKEASKSRE